MIRYLSIIISTLIASGLTGHSARAAEGGYSNYIPGTYGDFAMAVAPAESWTLRNDIYYYNADTDVSVRSGRLEIGTEMTLWSNFTTLLYKPDIDVFGAQIAAGVFVPLVDLEIDAGLSIGERVKSGSSSATGLSDITLIPFALYWNSGNFHTSLAQFIVMPTGDYDVDKPVNKSLNYWSFDTNFALTYLDEASGRDWSFNIGHIYNTKNDDTDYQTGREIHIDVALNQFLSETFAIGLHGFYLKQISGDSGDGAILGNFKAEAAGVGPAVFWATRIGSQDVSFIGKWLHEFHAENRLEGDHVFFSFAMDW